jgi:hypothetical protein
MPATAGRVSMPHNNRMSTSATLNTSSIWQTIGHDPYGPTVQEESKQEAAKISEADAEKVRNVMEMVKSQNVTDGANRDDFTSKMYFGLKRGKQRRKGDGQQLTEAVDPSLQRRLEVPSSSSEDEFVEVVAVKKEEKKKSSRKKKHSKRKRQSSSSSSSDDSSSEEDEADRKERKRRKEKRKRKRDRKRAHESDDSSDSEEDDRRSSRRRKEKRPRKEDRKKSSRKDGDKREHKSSKR